MSKTDKDKPYWVRLEQMNIEGVECEWRGRSGPRPRLDYDIPDYFAWNNRERGVGPGEARWAKRYRSKKNRRRDVPHRAMRGYGWGDENYKINW